MTAALPPFQRVLDEHATALWGYLTARVGADVAADLHQETVLRALRAYPRLRHADHLRSWLLTIAHNLVVDEHRARARRAVPTAELPERHAPPDPAATRIDDGHVWELVRALAGPQRDALALRIAADLPYREVAAILGCSEAAARQRVRTALVKLRAARGEEGA